MEQGFITDHSGKRSSTRLVALISAITLCGLAIGQATGYAEPVEDTLMYILGGSVLGPLGFNRWFGEKKNEGS